MLDDEGLTGVLGPARYGFAERLRRNLPGRSFVAELAAEPRMLAGVRDLVSAGLSEPDAIRIALSGARYLRGDESSFAWRVAAADPAAFTGELLASYAEHSMEHAASMMAARRVERQASAPRREPGRIRPGRRGRTGSIKEIAMLDMPDDNDTSAVGLEPWRRLVPQIVTQPRILSGVRLLMSAEGIDEEEATRVLFAENEGLEHRNESMAWRIAAAASEEPPRLRTSYDDDDGTDHSQSMLLAVGYSYGGRLDGGYPARQRFTVVCGDEVASEIVQHFVPVVVSGPLEFEAPLLQIAELELEMQDGRRCYGLAPDVAGILSDAEVIEQADEKVFGARAYSVAAYTGDGFAELCGPDPFDPGYRDGLVPVLDGMGRLTVRGRAPQRDSDV